METIFRSEHPNPQFIRENWINLNGVWQFEVDSGRSGKAKGVRFTTINKICYYLHCDVGDILTFDGELIEED